MAASRPCGGAGSTASTTALPPSSSRDCPVLSAAFMPTRLYPCPGALQLSSDQPSDKGFTRVDLCLSVHGSQCWSRVLDLFLFAQHGFQRSADKAHPEVHAVEDACIVERATQGAFPACRMPLIAMLSSRIGARAARSHQYTAASLRTWGPICAEI